MAGPFQLADAWTDAFLEPMRQVGDQPADLAIATMFAAGDVGAVNALMLHLVNNEEMIPKSLPETVKKFLATTEDLPPFADAAKIRIAEELFFSVGTADHSYPALLLPAILLCRQKRSSGACSYQPAEHQCIAKNH